MAGARGTSAGAAFTGPNRLDPGGFMRLRLTAFALAAVACGFAAAGAAEPAKTDAAPGADLAKYLPEDATLYVHVNVRQFLGAPVIRKAIPMAAAKFEKQIMFGVQLAMAAAPGAGGNVSEDQVKQVLAGMKDEATIAQVFDTVKDAVTDVVITADPGDEQKGLVVIGCNPAVSPELVKAFAPQLQNNPQVPIKLKMHEKGDTTVYEFQAPQQPQALFFALPKAGVVCIGASQDAVAKAAGGKGGLNADLKKVVAGRKKTDFLFVGAAGAGKGDDKVVAGFGRLVLDKDVSGEMSATYASAEKAQAEAKEANEHIAHAVEAIKDKLGGQAKDVAPVLEKAKATANGNTVTAKFNLPGTVLEKLLAKEKE
jgi:hypothetical protein